MQRGSAEAALTGATQRALGNLRDTTNMGTADLQHLSGLGHRVAPAQQPRGLVDGSFSDDVTMQKIFRHLRCRGERSCKQASARHIMATEAGTEWTGIRGRYQLRMTREG